MCARETEKKNVSVSVSVYTRTIVADLSEIPTLLFGCGYCPTFQPNQIMTLCEKQSTHESSHVPKEEVEKI